MTEWEEYPYRHEVENASRKLTHIPTGISVKSVWTGLNMETFLSRLLTELKEKVATNIS